MNWTMGPTSNTFHRCEPAEADGSGSILQHIPHGLSAGIRVCACGQGGSHWGPETACPWCKPAKICWCAQQVLWGLDTVRCTELLQKSVPWGTTGLQWSRVSHLCAGRRGSALHRDRSSRRCARGSGGSVSAAHCRPGRCGLSVCRMQSSQFCSENAKTFNADTDGRLGPRACVSSYLHTQTYSSLKSIRSHMWLSASVCTCISHKCNVGAQPSEVSKLSIRHWIGNSKIKENWSIIISEPQQQIMLMKAFGPVRPSVPIESFHILRAGWTCELVFTSPQCESERWEPRSSSRGTRPRLRGAKFRFQFCHRLPAQPDKALKLPCACFLTVDCISLHVLFLSCFFGLWANPGLCLSFPR